MKDKKQDKLEEFCEKCAGEGISYREAQRLEWIAQEKRKKKLLEIAKKREIERQTRN